jgi:hypothetical protein
VTWQEQILCQIKCTILIEMEARRSKEFTGHILHRQSHRSVYLAPLEYFTIIKLDGQNSNRVELNWPPPKFCAEVAVTPEFPPSTFAVAGNESWVVTNLFQFKISLKCTSSEEKSIHDQTLPLSSQRTFCLARFTYLTN